MAITYPGRISDANASKIRDAVSAVDNATINDTNYPPANLTDCSGCKSVIVFPRFQNGTTPNCKIRPMYRVGDAWVLGDVSGDLTEGLAAVIQVMGRKVYFAVTALAGGVASTDVDIYCSAWEPFRYDGPARG